MFNNIYNFFQQSILLKEVVQRIPENLIMSGAITMLAFVCDKYSERSNFSVISGFLAGILAGYIYDAPEMATSNNNPILRTP
jgi:hypothetical protein